MQRKIISWPHLFLSLLVILLMVGAFIGGAASERASLLPGKPMTEPAPLASTFRPFWETWDLVQQKYVDRKAIDPTQMTYGAIQGMLQTLNDPGHTRFLSPQDLQEEQQSLSGELEGIGCEMGVRDGRPTVIAPIAGSPAQKAGIRPGDVFLRVDGRDVTGLTLEQLISVVRGPAGTSVNLTVLHADDPTPVDIKLTRAKITVQSVTWAQLPGTTVAHVLISQFDEHANDGLVAALKAAKAAGVTAIILDLRNDPGGLRDEAIAVASQFLKDGNVFQEQDAEGQRNPVPVKSGGVATDIPMAILINEGSASAAEIVAGALQDHQRGPLIGATTFGTGTVLSSFDLSDGSAVLLGTLEWLTANGRQIWHQGISPDISVALPANVIPLIPDEETGLTVAQLQASQDTQLLRALQEVSQVPVASGSR